MAHLLTHFGPFSSSEHIAFLEEKAQEYCNNDSDAALKVLLDYAMTDGDEALIFETVRCNTCGGKVSMLVMEAPINR